MTGHPDVPEDVLVAVRQANENIETGIVIGKYIIVTENGSVGVYAISGVGETFCRVSRVESLSEREMCWSVVDDGRVFTDTVKDACERTDRLL
jgi:hypothetical protein